jgi:hypothetical protein
VSGLAVNDIVQFVVAIAFSVALYAWLAFNRRRGRGGVLVEHIRAMRLHHIAVGGVMGYTCLMPLRAIADMGLPLVVAFLCSWFAMAVGCAVDLRVLRKIRLQMAMVEMSQLLLLGLVLLLMISLVQSDIGVGKMALGAIGGICAASWPQQKWSEKKKRLSALTPHWMPSVAIWGGILLVGIGSMHTKTASPIFIYQPFSNSLVVDGFIERILGSVLLGGLIGLLADLATRGARTQYFPYIIAGGIMMGAGIGSSVAFESLWVGGIAGFWLINATLRRVAVLELVEGGTNALRAGVSIVVGWILGVQCVHGEVNGSLFVWSFVLFMLLPVIRLISWRMTGEQIGAHLGPIQWFVLGDFALVTALSLTTFVDPAAAAGLLVAFLLAQATFTASSSWLSASLVRLLENIEKNAFKPGS